MHSSLSTPQASRRMSENLQQENNIDRTPRSAMTLSRREMLEQWRASKRQRDTDQSVGFSENLPFNGRRGNLPPLETPQKMCTLDKNFSTLSMEFEGETTRPMENHASLMNSIVENDSEQNDTKEIESNLETLLEPKPDSLDSATVPADEEKIDVTVTTDVEAVNVNQQTDIKASDSVINQSDFLNENANMDEQIGVESTNVIIEPIAVEPLHDDSSQSEVCKEDVMSQITLDQQMEEYEVPLLLLANDTLVLQLAESEARRIAECSRLRQERDELRLELNMQEARFKVHVKRMEQAMQEGLMASLERIQELSSELEAARAFIESLQLKSKSSKRN